MTAQRRAESVQDVPNVVSYNNTGLASANSYYICGLGGTESLATADPPVGTYVDEIYISRQSANNLSLFDVERVEVLRGSQGTLFGRNTAGGVVSIVLAPPGDELDGFVEVGVGSRSKQAIRASIDLPFGDRFAAKVTGYWNGDDGYVNNVVTNERLNDEEAKGGRIALRADFTDTLQWNVAALYTETFSANVLSFTCNPGNLSDCSGRFASTGLLRNSRGANRLAPLNLANGKGNLPLSAETRFSLVSSNLKFEIGSVTLKSITGYLRTEQDFFDGRAAPIH